MEYADGGDLLQKIFEWKRKAQFFDEGYIWDVFSQVIMGLGVLHEMKILHRDIKVHNLIKTECERLSHEKRSSQTWRSQRVKGDQKINHVRNTNWYSLLRKSRSLER